MCHEAPVVFPTGADEDSVAQSKTDSLRGDQVRSYRDFSEFAMLRQRDLRNIHQTNFIRGFDSRLARNYYLLEAFERNNHQAFVTDHPTRQRRKERLLLESPKGETSKTGMGFLGRRRQGGLFLHHEFSVRQHILP